MYTSNGVASGSGRPARPFVRGDVAVITGSVTDDVNWAAEASGKGAPWYGDHRGPDGVAAFFNEFGAAMEVEEDTAQTEAALLG